MKIFKSPYSEYEVHSLKWGKGPGGNNTLQLLDKRGESIAVASSYKKDFHLGPDEMLVKDYSENQGILDFLIENGICSKPKYYIASGFVDLVLVDILEKKTTL